MMTEINYFLNLICSVFSFLIVLYIMRMWADSIIIFQFISNASIKLSDGLFKYLTLNAVQENVFIYFLLFIYLFIF